MSVDRKLAWAGLFIGIVALVPAVREAGWAWSMFLVLIVLLVGGYLIYSEWSSTRSAVTILSLEKRVTIYDKDGKQARLNRVHKIRVNQGWLNEYWFRNMVSDGTLSSFTIDGKAPAGDSRLGCLVSYYRRFEPGLSKGTQRDIALACDAQNCFTSSEEGLLHEVAQDTRELILKVELPADRICKECGLKLEAAGEPTKELEAPEVSPDRRTLTATIKNPRAGFTYHLHWNW